MGFIKNIDYSGIPITSVYHRIDVTQSAAGQGVATINTYASRDRYLTGSGFLTQQTIEFPIKYGVTVGSDKNQAYEYIKTLTDFEDASDVFEEGQPN